MVAIRLAKLIESHSDRLADGLIAKIRTSQRMTSYQNVPHKHLEKSVREIYRDISGWLLTKTESDIELRFTQLGSQRAAENVPLSQLLLAIAMTKEHLWTFLQREALVDRPVELFGELELMILLDQFFDRALYYAALGYEREESNPRVATATSEIPLERIWL